MGEEIADKPKLIPSAVPWEIDAAISDLRFVTNESGLEKSAQVELNAIVLDEHAGFWNFTDRRIAVVFGSALAARFIDPEQGRDPLSDYDTSLLMQLEHVDDLERFRRAYQQKWWSERLCPDPGFYEVSGSDLLQRLSSAPQRHRHFLLFGHDEHIEIVARGFKWSG